VTLALVPLPPQHVEDTRPIWTPFVKSIADRSRNDPAEMERMLQAAEVQAFFVWDNERHRAQAFIGVQYVMRGSDRLGQMIWVMGEDRKAWTHLFVELETYLETQQGCVGMKAISRPGWTKTLKANGYRLTHQVMEKDF
jgi:hypothetical protein